MSVLEPWVMAVHADTVGADERQQLAQTVEARIGCHPDWILFSTCHRVELYGFGTMPDMDTRLQVETGEEAVGHLIRVAAGLESAIIGEDEVLHQVREALGNARAARSLDRRLQRLFETAIAAGRRARAGRTASSGNLAQRAVAWLQQRSTLAGRTVLIVGAGRMGSSLAHSARLAGAAVTIASRDATRAHRLAQVYGGRGIDLAGGAELAPKSAGIAVALAGIWHEFEPPEGDLPPIADISAPPAVPAAVRARLNGGFLGIDDLYVRTQTVPRGYIDEADRVVVTKTREYVRWLEGGR
jgi:glutamyl-tRNA reductase